MVLSSERPLPVAHLFWNVAPEALDVERCAPLIMAAVMSRGELEDARWLMRTYGRERVRQFLEEDIRGRRQLPRAARKLWAAWLCPDIPRAELEDSPGERWGSRRRLTQREVT